MICVGIAANLANLPYAFSTLPSSPSSLPSCLTSWIQWAISVASTRFYFRKKENENWKKKQKRNFKITNFICVETITVPLPPI